MTIKAYENIANRVLDEVHTTQDGKTYTIRCDEKLVVDMNYAGKGLTTSNSQGWERNSTKYFQQLQQNYPEMFSTKNNARIQNGQAPIIDNKMIEQNPQYAQFKGEPLVHHHIGGDGQAAAVPRSVHKGFGEIHNHEKNSGITQNCKDFSQKCDAYVQKNPSAQGKNATEMCNLVGIGRTQSSSQSRGNNFANTQRNTSGQTTQNITEGNAKNSAQTSQSSDSRSGVVKGILDSKNGQTNVHGQSRTRSVNDVLSGSSYSHQNSGSAQSRGVLGESNSCGQGGSGKTSGGQSSSNWQSR